MILFRFTAYWLQGPIRAWNTTADDWERGWEQANSNVIILKRIKNSNNATSDFIGEVRNNLSVLNAFVLFCFVH